MSQQFQQCLLVTKSPFLAASIRKLLPQHVNLDKDPADATDAVPLAAAHLRTVFAQHKL